MIASIQGTILDSTLDQVIINIGGIGVEVLIPQNTRLPHDNEPVFLHTRLIVREDALILYGFQTTQERDLFDTLIKINGVGPKLANTILGVLSLDNLRNAVATDRVEILTRVPGVGKKTAQKILLELKDKLPVGLDAIPSDSFSSVNSDVMDALTSLGYSVMEAQLAIQALPHDAPENVEERVRLSLQSLSR